MPPSLPLGSPETTTDLETGLSSAEVQSRLRANGYNEVPERRESMVLRFLRRFWGVTPWMLELTATLTLVLGRLLETYIVLGLLVLNGVLGFYQEQRASAAITFLRQQLRVRARVKREGIWSEIPARELVPGDVVRVRAGDFVPADITLRSGSVEVDQSALTGESLAVARGPDGAVVSGSTINHGEGTGVVTATGTRTYFGRTVELVEIAKPKLHMEEVISKVVQSLLAMVGVLLAVGLAFTAFRGGDIVGVLPLAVVLLVSAIPVALPTMFTISMALGSLDLAKKGVLIARLSAGEDAATMDVLCADKTGTITMNRLSVAEVVALEGYTSEDVLRFGALASEEANRDPVDLAFLEAAETRHIEPNHWVQRDFVPFDPSTRRTAAAIEKDGRRLYVLKGAISAVVAPRATGGDLGRVLKEVERLSTRGFRSIAVAVGPTVDHAVPIGIVALADPPRPDSARFVAELRELGLSVKMLTGDALPIAIETARLVGLGDRVAPMVALKADRRAGINVDAVEKASGFAEIYPEDKYLVVKGLQEHGHVVGMTGDGVNDAPALRQAEVGIAVNNATDVAKKSSSVVLTADGLGGIADLVKTGRRIYQRIATWILNKIVKTFQIVVFVVLAFLLTGLYVVDVFSMILFLFVTDFVTLALATDTVRYSQKPDTWNVAGLAKVGISLGILIVLESLVLLYLALHVFGLGTNPEALHTFFFDYLVFLGVLNVFILRERRRFWESRPSQALLAFVLADLAFVVGISFTGILDLPPIPPLQVLAVLAFSTAAAFLVNDTVKVRLIQAFGI
jgi:H+-transporting ATPase